MAVQGTDYEILLKMRADMAQAVQQLNLVQAELRKTSDSASGAGAGMRSMGTDTGTLVNRLKTLPGLASQISFGFHDLRNILVGAFAIHEVASFTGELVNANVEAQKIHYTLQQVFGEQGASQQFKFVTEQAERLGLNLQAAAEGYAQLAAAGQGTGVQTQDLQKLFVGLSEAATVLHSSTADVNGVMIQLAQGMSLGRLQMQDIRAIAQHLPGTMTLVSEAAKRMGLDFQTALKSGGIPAIQFLSTFADVLHERFGGQAVEASHSLNAELNRLKTTLFEATTQGNDFADSFVAALRELNTTLADPGVRQGLTSLISLIGDVASGAIKAAEKLGEFGGGVRLIAQYAAAQKSGAILNDTGLEAMQTRLQADQAELSARGNSSNVISQNSGRLRRAVFTWSDSQSRAAIKSTKDLAAEIADITAKISAYRAQSGAVAGPNPQEGDNRGLTFAEGPTGAPPKGGPGKGDAAAAAKTARDAAAAQQQLTQSLIGLQGQLDPTAAIYAKYNEAVAKATDEAELAKKAHGADAQAIDAQKQAVIGLAGKIRDAALDQLADKDRQAWEALRRSFETPAQVRVEDALKQIAQLNEMLKTGVINAQQYHDALGQIGQKSVAGALPTYQGVDAAVGGPYGELQKNYQAQTALDTAYNAQKLALDKQFNDQDEAQHATHVAALAALDEDHAKKTKQITDARGTLQLSAASNLFGQLATLSSSHNKKMAAIGKAAAIAQTVITTYQSATEAFAAMASIPYVGPALGAAAAAVAIAAGLANVAAIRSQSTGGYATGGHVQGAGSGTSDSIPAMLSNGEYVVRAAAVQKLGVPYLDSLNRARFADGGVVSPFANAPSPADLGFAVRPAPNVRMPAPGDRAQASPPQVHVKNVIVQNSDQLAEEILNTPTGVKLIVHHVGNNPRAIQGKWRT